MDTRKVFHRLIVLFAAVYYVARIAIFYAVSTGSMDPGVEMTDFEDDLTNLSFLAIGVLGLVLLPGVYLKKAWGLWGTVAVSAYTIAFDAWGLAAVAASAAAGMVPAAVLIVYLAAVREEFLGSR